MEENVKKLLLISAFLLASVATVRAGDPVSVMAWPNSSYSIAQSSVQVSSGSVTTIAADSGYRAVYISNLLNPTTTIYYRIDGSTASIPTVGWPIPPGALEAKIETDSVISLQLAAGASVTAIDVRRKIIKK